MTAYVTRFGSLDDYEKGTIDIIDDDPKHYAFSNVFEVASHAKPWEKIAVGKNMEYVLEVDPRRGHQRVADVRPRRVRRCAWTARSPSSSSSSTSRWRPPTRTARSAVDGEPVGRPMGRIVLRRGHMALLPADARRTASAPPAPGVILLQTIHGDDTVERWAEICLSLTGTTTTTTRADIHDRPPRPASRRPSPTPRATASSPSAASASAATSTSPTSRGRPAATC